MTSTRRRFGCIACSAVKNESSSAREPLKMAKLSSMYRLYSVWIRNPDQHCLHCTRPTQMPCLNILSALLQMVGSYAGAGSSSEIDRVRYITQVWRLFSWYMSWMR
jgi:hypothetical protein